MPWTESIVLSRLADREQATPTVRWSEVRIGLVALSTDSHQGLPRPRNEEAQIEELVEKLLSALGKILPES